METNACQRSACKVQECLAESNYDERACAWAIDRLKRCCEKMGEGSTHCAFSASAPASESKGKQPAAPADEQQQQDAAVAGQPAALEESGAAAAAAAEATTADTAAVVPAEQLPDKPAEPAMESAQQGGQQQGGS